MSLKLRLKRFGRRHDNCYRIAAVDSRTPRDGRVVEEIGWYQPQAKDADKQVNLKRERAEYWLSVGAQPSDTVRQILKKQGVKVS